MVSEAMVRAPDGLMARACAIYARPEADGPDCLAWMYGLRGAASLRPWQAGETNDVSELARRDFEPDHGDAWRDEWARRLEESSTMVRARLGKDWSSYISDAKFISRNGDMTH